MSEEVIPSESLLAHETPRRTAAGRVSPMDDSTCPAVLTDVAHELADLLAWVEGEGCAADGTAAPAGE